MIAYTSVLNAALSGQVEIVEYLTKNKSIQISLKDKIDALDLLGATLIQRDDISRGVNYWKIAFRMRYGVVIYNKKNIDFSDEFQEIITFEQLEEIQNNPISLQNQSLLVIERILGPTHENTFKNFISMDRDFGEILKLWNHNINNILSAKNTLNNHYPGFFKYYEKLEIRLFLFLQDIWNDLTITIEDILLILKMCKTGLLLLEMTDLSFDIFQDRQSCIMNLIIYCLAYLFIKCKNDLTIHQWQLIKETVEFYVKKDPRSRFERKALLHIACNFNDINRISRDKIVLPMIKLILDSGANPCSTDRYGNTPLHLLDNLRFSNELRKDIANALLLSGAHLDAVNDKGKSFKNFQNNDDLEPIFNPLHYTSLQCLASACIRKHGIPYNEKILPKILCKFVDMH